MTARLSDNPAAAGAGSTRQVLTFSLGSESYGVDILRVQEIRGWTPVTRIPQAPGHVLGVLNLRGSIVPIIDLRKRLNLAKAEFTPLTVIIVLSVNTAAGAREFGVVVDAVSDVVGIGEANLKEAPRVGSGDAAEIVSGLAVVAERLLILLNVDELVRRDLEQVPPSELASVA